jgi:hypothetical protein
MRRNIFPLVLVIPLFFSCASSAPVKKNLSFTGRNFLDTSPYNDELVFLGVAGNRTNKNEAIRLALEDAARKAAMYQSVGGHIFLEESRGTGFFDYSSRREAVLEFDENYPQYIDFLTFDENTDILINNNTVFVRTRCAPQNPLRIPHDFSAENQKPSWVDRTPPKIPGYITEVGFAGPRFYHKDTVIASYENAAFSLIEAAGLLQVTANQTIGSAAISSSASVTVQGVLQGFYVLEIWVDPATMAVWTLAIAREG